MSKIISWFTSVWFNRTILTKGHMAAIYLEVCAIIPQHIISNLNDCNLHVIEEELTWYIYIICMLLIFKVGCINCYSLKVLKEFRKILIDHVHYTPKICKYLYLEIWNQRIKRIAKQLLNVNSIAFMLYSGFICLILYLPFQWSIVRDIIIYRPTC